MSDTDLIIDENRVVSMHYQLTNGFGELIDSSQGDLPLVYMHNTNALLPALERELTGRLAGEPVAITIYPEDAYGYPDETLIAEWPKEPIEKAQELVVGMRFKAMGKDGESQLVTVVEIREDTVVLDANHPLAGQVLSFTIAIVDVREPSAEELEQGYAVSTNPAGLGSTGSQA
ncbi:FKBP-type peptidyl-prolyl cis-trans isomerase [Granulosicoccus antarcticus]|uniref:Peptidyl-prolyl cis-trans isomerase n=1 Tax=Granulosicoccus antarcticus IMCC3135 TaxID=1192854 RepID=A0A2Z2P2B2_9GAMM|nr:peptidylprolyl isomerase [Granulosicoccus antarcticus]ASJ74677.1 FKBP-type peptidyl-prolyl cis-trans isomerase SlyD [Granulosicoccus antarcticus IMCC3135]